MKRRLVPEADVQTTAMIRLRRSTAHPSAAESGAFHRPCFHHGRWDLTVAFAVATVAGTGCGGNDNPANQTTFGEETTNGSEGTAGEGNVSKGDPTTGQATGSGTDSDGKDPAGTVGNTDSGGSDGAGSTGSSDGVKGDSDSGVRFDVGTPDGDTDGTPSNDCRTRGTCTNKIDMLFVIDNSGTMGEEQRNLARNFPLLVEQLKDLQTITGQPTDVNMMVTTTDMGGPWCRRFDPPGYVAVAGAPVSTGCNARIGDFTEIAEEGAVPFSIPQACTDACPTDIVPSAPFIHFDGLGDNVPDGTPGEALSCLGPQGINGCGYEATLESMMQGLNVSACWNDPTRPGCATDPRFMGLPEGFLRDDAILAIVVITDEADCSVKDYSILTDPAKPFQETDPLLGQKYESSAICWNAGVTCDGPNGNGIFTNCTSANFDGSEAVNAPDADAVLQPISRYVKYLNDYFVNVKKREVVMLGILGVPLVTRHANEPPFEPTGGGVASLVYRTWRDGEYPLGDILPDEWDIDGKTAADKKFEFGIGPGCTGEGAIGGSCTVSADCATGFQCASGTCISFTGQATPPVRIKEVCESLNREDDPGTTMDETAIRCCIESICDTDFSAAIRCLTGIIGETVRIPR